MSIKWPGIEFGLNEHEAKVLDSLGSFFRKVYEEFYGFIKFRCPHCKSRKIVFKEYVGDEPLELYSCFACGEKSVMTEDALVGVSVSNSSKSFASSRLCDSGRKEN